MLCDACEKIFDSSIKIPHAILNNRYVHHDAAYQIEAASEGGCFICSTIWDGLTEEEKHLVRSERAKKLQATTISDNMKRHFGVVWRGMFWSLYRFLMAPEIKQALRANDYNSYGWTAIYERGLVIFYLGTTTWKEVAFMLLPDSDAMRENQTRLNLVSTTERSVNELIGSGPVSEDMRSDEVWDLVQGWHTECSTLVPGHSRCHEHRLSATSAIPTRLVDVMSGGDRNQIRLTVSPQEREPLPYVTLSYTWGGIDQNKLHLLRKDTLQAYQDRIPDQHLPTLFRDVIDVVRRLNFRYIWIDAYCIIQQDPADFQIEAASMGEIYQHAALNIAAGGAQNPNSRLMGDRNTALVNPCPVRLDWDNLALQMGHSPDKPLWAAGSYYIFDGKYIDSEILQTPLNRRAWVMQEQQLSPRILHFGKNQVFWRCWSEAGELRQACETFPKGTPEALGFQRAHQYGLQTAVPESIRQMLQLDMQHQWNQLVMAYTRCDITREADRLIAISGLAANFATVLKQDSTDYAAGLWRSGLPMFLYWEVDISPLTWGQRSTRYSNYVGPSWSWVSVKGSVRFYDPIGIKTLLEKGYEMRFLCSDDFKIAMELVTPENPYGQVKYGQISFSGFVVPCKKLNWARNPRKNPARGQLLNVVLCLVLYPPVVILCSFDDMDDYEPQKIRGSLSPLFYKTRGIQLIPLLYIQHPTEPQHSVMQGLVVVREPQSNAFKRIGTFRSENAVYKYPAFSMAQNLFYAMEEWDEIVLI